MNNLNKYRFRGSRRDGKGWVYGDLVKCPTNIYIIPMGLEINMDTGAREVDPETVGIFTTFADVKKVDIFEGDIVEIFFKNISGKFEVIQENGSWYLFSENIQKNNAKNPNNWDKCPIQKPYILLSEAVERYQPVVISTKGGSK